MSPHPPPGGHRCVVSACGGSGRGDGSPHGRFRLVVQPPGGVAGNAILINVHLQMIGGGPTPETGLRYGDGFEVQHLPPRRGHLDG